MWYISKSSPAPNFIFLPSPNSKFCAIVTSWVDPSITIPSELSVCSIKLLPVVVFIVPLPDVKLILLLAPAITRSVDPETVTSPPISNLSLPLP